MSQSGAARQVFYDLDTPVTLSTLAGAAQSLNRSGITSFSAFYPNPNARKVYAAATPHACSDRVQLLTQNKALFDKLSSDMQDAPSSNVTQQNWSTVAVAYAEWHGLDCSTFTAWVLDFEGLGLMTSAIGAQACSTGSTMAPGGAIRPQAGSCSGTFWDFQVHSRCSTSPT